MRVRAINEQEQRDLVFGDLKMTNRVHEKRKYGWAELEMEKPAISDALLHDVKCVWIVSLI